MVRKLIFVTAIVMLAGLVLAACGQKEPAPTEAPAATAAPVEEADTETEAGTDESQAPAEITETAGVTETAEVTETADTETADSEKSGAAVDEETMTALANMEYMSEFTQEGVAPLENGEYSEEAAPGSATKTVVTLTDNVAAGEIDGEPTIAVVLVTDPGGSGTFYDLALVQEQDGELVNVAITSLGDRVKINEFAIEDNQIVVDMINAGPDDPMCCPTQHVVRTYGYQNGELTQTNEEVLGTAEAADVSGSAGITETAETTATAEISGAVSAPSAGAAPVAGSPLDGTSWQLESYVDDQGQTQKPVAGAEPTISFEGGQANGTTGCNNYFGDYTADDDQLSFGPTGSTMMACPDPQMTQEQTYLIALGGVTSYTMTDEQLTMANEAGETVLTFVPREAPELVGTIWNSIGYNNGKQGVVSIVIHTQITAVFGEDGTLSGNAGCNDYSAGFEVDGESIAIGPAVATRKMCAEPEGVMEQEAQYLAALGMAQVYTIEGDRLQLRTAEGSLVADYKVEENAGAAVDEETMTALANMEYMSAITQEGVAPLENGEYSEEAAPGSATKTVVTLTDNVAAGEIDGEPTIAVVLVTDPGGSGTFYDLALVQEQDGELVNVAVTSLGDRVKINELAIEDNQIVVDMINAGPDDPMCCPTQHVVRTYGYQNGELTQTNEEVLGNESADASESGDTLVGPVWAWRETQSSDDSVTEVDDPSRYTIQFMEDGRVNVRADCNQVNGAYTTDGSQLQFEQPFTNTTAMCPPDSLDQQFLQELGAAASYLVEEGVLHISMIADGGVMTFAPLH